MNDKGQSQADLIREIKSLYSQIDELKKYKLALEAQEELMRSLVPMEQVSAGRIMLKSVLMQIINFATELTQAQECSMFILSTDGVVVESVLARGPTIRDDKNMLIGTVLDKGLAGWVFRNGQPAVIQDTTRDKRWLNLPEQPYAVRSAFCLPFVRGRFILGILTLTDPEPNKFSPDVIKIMEISAGPIALVLDNARLYMASA
jgi:GAF domain-containing protein